MYKNKELFREQHETVLEHLAKSSAKAPSIKTPLAKPVLPSVTLAVQKLNDFIKQRKSSKPQKESMPELSLAKWYCSGSPRDRETVTHKPDTFSPVKPVSEKLDLVEEEFPTLSQVRSLTPKKLSYLDDTESSRHLTSENAKERDLETSLCNLSSLDRLILKKLKTSCGLPNRSRLSCREERWPGDGPGARSARGSQLRR